MLRAPTVCARRGAGDLRAWRGRLSSARAMLNRGRGAGCGEGGRLLSAAGRRAPASRARVATPFGCLAAVGM
eukprot:6671225-Prymnesium_polylepis.1